MNPSERIAVVVPCYRVAAHIVDVVRGIPAYVSTIILVDDGSPDDFVARVEALADPRVTIVRHERNRGVGAAMATGYAACLERDIDIVVKMDGDGQMDPAALPALLQPLLDGAADYTKGNRWHDRQALRSMPWVRRVGSFWLSLLTRFASGYWKVFDSCNGYTAIRTSVLAQVPLDRLGAGYFFETSLLIQLNILGAVVRDVPIPARYGSERSNLSIARVLGQFPFALLRGTCARIWERYFVREPGLLAACLLCGWLLVLWGVVVGRSGLLAALPCALGGWLLLQAVLFDLASEPVAPLCLRAEPVPA